jgi:hypothetical protein
MLPLLFRQAARKGQQTHAAEPADPDAQTLPDDQQSGQGLNP